MNFLFWNCRGAGNIGFRTIVHDLRKLYNCNIMAFVEPRVSRTRAEKNVEKLNFESNFMVEAEGMSGGIWLLWNKSRVNLKILAYSRHTIHGIVNEGRTDFVAVYGSVCKPKCHFKEAML